MRTAVIVSCVLAAMPAAAKQREGVTSQPVIEVAGRQLHLMGMGLRKKFIFKVYMASFYLEEPTEDAAKAISSEQVKRVEMHMLRDLERGKITEAVKVGFERNSGPQMPKLQDRLDQFLSAIPDLKAGEAITVTYLPAKGTVIKAGTSSEMVLPGKDFADALFSVWLGAHPVDDGLKNEMLKNR